MAVCSLKTKQHCQSLAECQFSLNEYHPSQPHDFHTQVQLQPFLAQYTTHTIASLALKVAQATAENYNAMAGHVETETVTSLSS